MKTNNALVTGVTGDIGSAVARALLDTGYAVVGTGRHEEAPTSLVSNPNFIYVAANLRDEQSVASLFQTYQPSEGKNVIVHCAGTLLLKTLLESTPDEIEQEVRTNLLSAIWIAREVRGVFTTRRMTGSVVFIGSRWAAGSQQAPVYAACKAGLKGLVSSLQKDADTFVRFILLSPGSIAGRMSRSVDASASHLISTSEIARTIVHMVESPQNVMFEEVVVKAYPYDFNN